MMMVKRLVVLHSNGEDICFLISSHTPHTSYPLSTIIIEPTWYLDKYQFFLALSQETAILETGD